MNFASLLRDKAGAQPGRVALHSRESSWTWTDLDALVDRAAAGLLASGATKVAICLPNTIEFVVALLGTIRAGLIAVPVNPAFTAREIEHVLADSGAELLIRDKAPDATPSAPFPEVDDDQVGVLLYTSGTEGAPKGAMLTHRALMANHRQLEQIEPPILSADDVLLLGIPLFHAYGLNTGLGSVLWYGATGVLEPQFDPLGTAGLIALHRITAVVGVPAMYLAWNAEPSAPELLKSLRLAVCGAAALDPQSAAEFTKRTGLTVHIGYGLTETAPVLTSTLASASVKPGSIGKAIPGVELKLVNEYGTPAEDEPGEGDDDPGQIVVRGENLFLGYWPDRRGGPAGEDGWWPTGDVAYADAEGDLFIVDRIGELIIVNGFNVYPAEVEQVLLSHPAVREAAALGAPHELTGHTVHAFVVPQGAVTQAELAEHCAANLARFKCPTRIEIVSELPHSATGKVRKTLLRDQP
ncbi:long-chain acyl-CoA synthetase [Rhizocola hellebori]|uniref:Long-chain acyl-CoA synthetase n=1 Tax=Rhizocola hellebori TaxID=1392758 RepID=A0A8J3QDJ6_9ACTN|nr:AMP-binding protein [Rhizocola hellebori]GIH08716.1 long-chain acyl-CoA synthetase [Rhizocola hellebori]